MASVLFQLFFGSSFPFWPMDVCESQKCWKAARSPYLAPRHPALHQGHLGVQCPDDVLSPHAALHEAYGGLIRPAPWPCDRLPGCEFRNPRPARKDGHNDCLSVYTAHSRLLGVSFFSGVVQGKPKTTNDLGSHVFKSPAARSGDGRSHECKPCGAASPPLQWMRENLSCGTTELSKVTPYSKHSILSWVHFEKPGCPR